AATTNTRCAGSRTSAPNRPRESQRDRTQARGDLSPIRAHDARAAGDDGFQRGPLDRPADRPHMWLPRHVRQVQGACDQRTAGCGRALAGCTNRRVMGRPSPGAPVPDRDGGAAPVRSRPPVAAPAALRETRVLGGEHLVAGDAGDPTGGGCGGGLGVGTTTLVGTLMNLRTGMAAAVLSTLNGQAPLGADVISRISHGMNGPEAIRELQDAVVTTMNSVLDDLYREAGVSPQQTYEAVVVGNVTMLHLLLGVDPTPLSMSPFTPAFMDQLNVEAREVGLHIHPHGYVQTLPALGAYVG